MIRNAGGTILPALRGWGFRGHVGSRVWHPWLPTAAPPGLSRSVRTAL
jgi:hypothetical protein